MIYRQPEPRSLWGFWIIEWEGSFHIFFDEDINADYNALSWQKQHDHIGHAVSRDLVHWETRPSLSVKGKPGEWNEMPSGGVMSGCVIRHENKFYMFAGATQRDNIQAVGIWTSDDLDNWKQHPDNPILKPSAPYYLENPTNERPSVSWRDPGIIYCKNDNSYHMCISAMQESESKINRLGSIIGHLRSKDLIHWEYLPPFSTPGLPERFYQNEEAELFEIKGKYYLMFDGGTTGGWRLATPDREDVRGSFYMISSKLEGPYYRPDDDFLIGNGMGARCATTGRVIDYQDKKLFFHFSIARRPAIGITKILKARPDGTLYLEYLQAAEKLETTVIYNSFCNIPEFHPQDLGQWQNSKEKLSCRVKCGGSRYRIARNTGDFHLSCSIIGTSALRAGIIARIHENGDGGVCPRGIGIILDFQKQKIFLSDSTCYPKTGWFCKELDYKNMLLSRNKHYNIRYFVRSEYLEVYLDDIWIFTMTIPEPGSVSRGYQEHYRFGPETANRGNIELMVEEGNAKFSGFRLATLEAMK